MPRTVSAELETILKKACEPTHDPHAARVSSSTFDPSRRVGHRVYVLGRQHIVEIFVRYEIVTMQCLKEIWHCCHYYWKHCDMTLWSVTFPLQPASNKWLTGNLENVGSSAFEARPASGTIICISRPVLHQSNPSASDLTRRGSVSHRSKPAWWSAHRAVTPADETEFGQFSVSTAVSPAASVLPDRTLAIVLMFSHLNE